MHNTRRKKRKKKLYLGKNDEDAPGVRSSASLSIEAVAHLEHTSDMPRIFATCCFEEIPRRKCVWIWSSLTTQMMSLSVCARDSWIAQPSCVWGWGRVVRVGKEGGGKKKRHCHQ